MTESQRQAVAELVGIAAHEFALFEDPDQPEAEVLLAHEAGLRLLGLFLKQREALQLVMESVKSPDDLLNDAEQTYEVLFAKTRTRLAATV